MLADLRTALSAALIERDAEIDALLLDLIAREHTLLIGPPGVGKSMLCRSVAAGIAGARYCERLLSPTTPPEAIFGPISLSALREDRYEHVGDGSVTDCELLFLDEVFRGSDAIRDTMLHLLGPERQAQVGTLQVRAPLVSAVGASNSWADTADQAAIRQKVATYRGLLSGYADVLAQDIDQADKQLATAILAPLAAENQEDSTEPSASLAEEYAKLTAQQKVQKAPKDLFDDVPAEREAVA